MNAGKSAYLLMRAHAFLENSIPILCIKPSIDTRDGDSVIKSYQADEIAVISEGRVAEKGTHQELMALGGIYQQLYSLQFRAEDMA